MGSLLLELLASFDADFAKEYDYYHIKEPTGKRYIIAPYF